MHELAGRAALVTGGGVRIGAAVCRALADAGANVAVHYHSSAAPARVLVAKLRQAGVRAVAVRADLAKPAQRRKLMATAARSLGQPIDLLVNNASTFPARRLLEMDEAQWRDDLVVNAWAPFELVRDLAAQLGRREGSVVNFLDARIVDDDRRHPGYFLAKRMLADLTRLCALELGPRIAVNAVAPGPTLPPPGMDEAKGKRLLERLRQRLPLQRNSTPDDVARAVVYLAASRAHTGQVLFVDGGRHLGRPADLPLGD